MLDDVERLTPQIETEMIETVWARTYLRGVLSARKHKHQNTSFALEWSP